MDESRLRVIQNQEPFAYYENNMLVRLLTRSKRNRIIWRGNIVSTPLRSERALKEWVLNQQPRLVTLGNILDDGSIQIEIAPGILSKVKVENCDKQLIFGTLASIRLEDEKWKVEPLLQGDKSYIPEEGRPVELLIMDSILNKYGSVYNNSNKESAYYCQEKNYFTVARFPQLRLKDDEFLDSVIVKTPHVLDTCIRTKDRGCIFLKQRKYWQHFYRLIQ